MTNLNRFVTAVKRLKELNPTVSNGIINSHIAETIATQKEYHRANYFNTYNVALLDAIALTEDYSIESLQSLVDALPASDSDSMIERIKGILASGKGRKADYIVRDIESIVNGTSGNRQSVVDVSFNVLVSWLGNKHSKLNERWTGKDVEPLLPD
ncbi:hypothetical protein A4S05_23515 [Nostoc sp. KVJ20]|uniref:hypothetical protein n=1 Tax=Nostoc sp. KVJ20 TaxID=457944 RepID=UPI00083D4E83|nr:hypothetical protein [Nostoc sp. KVJ20]ODH02582.1 hypothetical protein A4S05_23515 [Nostoc sp. KVJ20]